LSVKKDAGAVTALREPIVPFPPAAAAPKERQVADLGILVPALRFDALFFFGRHSDDVGATTMRATVAVPILQNGQRMKRQRHGRKACTPGGVPAVRARIRLF